MQTTGARVLGLCLLSLLLAAPIMSRFQENLLKHEFRPCIHGMRPSHTFGVGSPSATVSRLRGGATVQTASEVHRSDEDCKSTAPTEAKEPNVTISHFPERVLVCVLPFGTQLANGFRHLCSCLVLARCSNRELRLGE